MRCSKRLAEDRSGESGAVLPRAAQRLRSIVLIATLVLLAGCSALDAQKPGMLAVREARISALADSATLELDLDCRLSGPMRDALEQGIPLTLQIEVRAGHWPNAKASAERRVELRYFPLSRRYQLRELESRDVRSFASPAYLLAALAALRLDLPDTFAALPAAAPLHVSVRLDPAALPGALRLPALFEPAWRLVAADYAWSEVAR